MSALLIACFCVAAAVVAFGLGYANGRADALDETGKAFCEALGKVADMTTGFLGELEKREP